MKIDSYRKHLLIIAAVALLGALLAYGAWEVVGKNVCPSYGVNGPITQEIIDCELIYFDNLYYPFSQGWLLYAVALSALVLLLFSGRVYKVWRWFALSAVPFAIFVIMIPLRYPPGQYFGKKESSDLWGLVFFVTTFIIAFSVTLWHKFRKN